MKIVTRADLGHGPSPAPALTMPTPRLWLHHTASEHHGPDGWRELWRFHTRTRGYADIAYSFLVDDDGTIYEGRGAGKVGAHTAGNNSTSHAICFMGALHRRAPHRAAVVAAGQLVRHGHERGWWPAQITGGHRDAPGAGTACPGIHGQAAIAEINRIASTRPDTPEEARTMGYVAARLIPGAGAHTKGVWAGRWPFVALQQDGSRWKLVGFNGARIDENGATFGFGVSVLWLPHPMAGPPIDVHMVTRGSRKGTVVVMAEDGGTFAARVSA